jgi:iron complex transport system substrate-binding protein
MTEIIYALGLGDRLIGRTDYCDYPPEVSSVESIGSIREPDLERIVELEPDLLIVSTHFTEENAAQLRELGITVLALYEEENFDGCYALVEKTGAALNRAAEAAGLVADMKAVVDGVTARVDGLEQPSVYYVVGFGEFGDYTAGGDTFIGSMLEMAGGQNIADEVQGWSYNLESLLEADPDIVILSQYFDSKALFLADENYKKLSAVANDKVFEIDNNMLDRQGVRNAEGLKALADIIHPAE